MQEVMSNENLLDKAPGQGRIEVFMDTPERSFLDELNREIQVDISQDRMAAVVCLKAAYGNTTFSYEEVMDALKQAGVKMGIDNKKIQLMLERKQYNIAVQIAEGKAVENGVDGRYELFFDPEVNGKPEVREDGSVDYYNIKLFEMVSKGDKLAQYIPPTKGVFGYDVCGKLLTPKPGKPKSPLRGKGFVMSEDGNTYIADLDGKVEYRNTDLNVINMLQINGNVDLNIGNIEFNGDVNITGNVISGVKVKAMGNIYIGGYVEGAVIESEKDIVFKDGVNGKGIGKIDAKGNISAKFLENALVTAQGDIQSGYILNSTVISNGKVMVTGSKGSIQGGDVTGIMGVEAGTIGNSSYAPTVIRVGPTKSIRKEYADLIMKLKEIASQIDMYAQALEKFNRIKQMYPDKFDQATYTKVFQSKIIKNSERAKYEQTGKMLYDLIREGGKAMVRVNSVLYPGSKLLIDGKPYELETELAHLQVRKFNDTIVVRDFDE